MAQTKSAKRSGSSGSKQGSSSNGSKASSTTSRSRSGTNGSGPSSKPKSGTSKKSTAKSKSANGRATSSKSKSSSGKASTARKRSASTGKSTQSKSRSSSSGNGAVGKLSEARDSVVSGAKGAGETVAEVSAKARTPLMAGGAALAGIAGGLAARRLGGRSKNPLQRALSKSPLSGKGVDLSKLDLQTLTSAGRRVGSLGQQIGEISKAVEEGRKKGG